MSCSCPTPITNYTHSHDNKGVFARGFSELRSKLDEKVYTCVQAFNDDLIAVLSAQAELAPMSNNGDVGHDSSRTAPIAPTSEQKETKKLVKRIIRSVQPHIEDALRKEAEMGRAPFEQNVDLETLLEQKMQSKRSNMFIEDAPHATVEMESTHHNQATDPTTNSSEHEDVAQKADDIQLAPTPDDNAGDNNHSLHDEAADEAAIAAQLGQDTMRASHGEIRDTVTLDTDQATGRTEPLTPPRSEKNLVNPLHNGGVPWYFEPFDIHGTTVHEPIWAGREVLKAMSEDLSELDDEELDGLAGSDPVQPDDEATDAQAIELRKAAVRKRQKRSRTYR